MAIWEKAVVNMERGTHRIIAFAEVFSDRVKAEISLARLRIKTNELQAQKDELYKVIGRFIILLKNKGELPKTSEQLMNQEELVAAMSELAQLELELKDLEDEIKTEQEASSPVLKEKETPAE
jgi:hypothetical protein